MRASSDHNQPGNISKPANYQTPPPAFLITATTHGRDIVVLCCRRAASLGVSPDMTVAHARALLINCDIHIITHQPRRDELALNALATWMIRFAPLVTPDPPDGIALDITGCQRLHHGERRLINTIANHLALLNINARVACASTLGCAWGMARYSGQERCIIPPSQEIAALAPLPIESLRLDKETIVALRELNIERVQDVSELPRLELAARFDPLLLRRLDQALGELDEAVEPLRPIEPPAVERAFDGPVLQIEAITQTVRTLLDELHHLLHKREIGVRTLNLRFERIDAQPIEQCLNLSHPSRNTRHLWSLLRPQIESLHLGFGVERVAITATSIGRLRHQQLESYHGDSIESADPASIKRAAGELVDNLNHRLGPQRVLKTQPVESHLPECAFIHRPILEEDSNTSPQFGTSKNTAAMTQSDRPSVLFAEPEPARVIAMTPDGPITWLHWRGRDHRIIQSIGPERIAEQWWSKKSHLSLRSRGSAVAGCGYEPAENRKSNNTSTTDAIAPPHALRDYFKVQDDRGRWLWIFRRFDTRQWYIHGEWT